MIGLALLVFGFLLFIGLIFLLLRFAVGASENPSLPSPLGEFVSFFIRLGTFWFVFVIVGTVLIAMGTFKES